MGTSTKRTFNRIFNVNITTYEVPHTEDKSFYYIDMLYFIRHGQSQANLDGVLAGQRLPAPLTPLGIRQAKEAGESILSQGILIDQIITSPIDRAKDTAEIIAHIINIDTNDIHTDPRIAEYDMGELTGKTSEGLTPLERISAPQAEDPREFRDRVIAAIEDASKLPGNTLIVSHAGVGRMIEATRQQLDAKRLYELKAYPNAQIIPLSLK